MRSNAASRSKSRGHQSRVAPLPDAVWKTASIASWQPLPGRKPYDRAEACLPLGLQCVAHPVLLGAVGDGRYSQRPEFLAALRDVHPLDRQGLPRRGLPLEAASQFRAVPGGQGGPARLPLLSLASVLRGDAPHADQRAGARAQHQPLKSGDLACVPGLLRREDPSPKTC